MSSVNNNIIEIDNNVLKNKVKTFRFNFSDEFINMMKDFSRIHKHDNKQDFKDYFDNWFNENYIIIESEFKKATDKGYSGDFKFKIFKSIKYYYCKKNNNISNEPKKRRKYISMNSEIISMMDMYIQRAIINKDIIKPSVEFDLFMEHYKTEINSEINELSKNNLSKEDIYNKFKKTFKNRYFNFTK